MQRVVRQQGDTEFVTILNEIREGIFSESSRAALEMCHVSRKPMAKDGIEPTRLYCTNYNVDIENQKHLTALSSPAVTILAADGCALSGAGAARLGKWAMTVSSLKELSLSDNPAMGDRGARAMADLVATHPKLHTLRLGATSMTDEGAVEIASALRSSSSL